MDRASSTKQILALNTPRFKIPFFGKSVSRWPSKHAWSDLEAFWLWPSMASMQSESGQILYAGSNFLHPFQLHFSKEGIDHSVQNQPRSNLDGLVRVWPNTSGLEASWCAGMIRPFSGRMQPACYQTWFHSSTNVPDNPVQNQPWSDLVLADCVRFWPNRSGPEASLCARIIQPTSGQRFPANLDWMRIRSSMFTENMLVSYHHLEFASTSKRPVCNQTPVKNVRIATKGP